VTLARVSRRAAARPDRGDPARGTGLDGALSDGTARDRPPEGTADLRIAVLGPLLVQRKGIALPLGRTAQRTVLGLLALSPNTAVSREAIIDSLWGSEPPDSAIAIFQTHVSRLRKLLGEGTAGRLAHQGTIIRDGSSYCLRICGPQLDLLAFEQMARQAQETAAAGDVAGACELFESALGLWRGEPLADIEILRDHPTVTSLTLRRGALILAYADAAFRAGQHTRVLPHLRALAGREPLNELAHAQLIMALAMSGQQAEALHTFSDVRRRLDAELGVTPGAALAEAQERVLRQELPTALAMEPGRTDHVGLPVCQLPLAPGDFTGRESECSRLAEIIVPGRDAVGVPLAVLSGPPGIGKTCLALHVAHRLRGHFPDGQIWVQLAGSSSRPRDPGEVLGELLRSLGVHGSAIPDRARERAAVYRSRLADRRVLLVADDVASAPQLEALLPGTAGSAVIATSRLRLAGLPYADFLPLDALSGDDALGMLSRIVGRARVTAEPEAARKLATECGLLPLAVRISGARLATRPSWPVSLMAKKLADERHRLDELQAGDLSVRASLAVSYDTLGEKAQRAFRRLGLLGPLDVADWIAGALLDEPDGSDAVAELVDKSLLTPLRADETGEPRYRLHDLLRDYATERLRDDPADEQDAALDRALRGWLQLTHLAVSRLPAPPFHRPGAGRVPEQIVGGVTAELLTADPVAWFNAERLNLNAAVEYACARGRPELAAELATLLGDMHYFLCRYDDAQRIWRTVGDAFAASGDTLNTRHAQLHLAEAKIEMGYAADTIDMLDECVEAFEAAQDLNSLAMALHWRSAAAFDLDLGEPARRDAERGVLIAQMAGNRHAECLNQRILGSSLHVLGLTGQAVAACECALSIAEELGEESTASLALSSLIFACNKDGQHERAIVLSRRRLQQARKYDEVHGEAMCLGMMGDAYQGLGRYHEAIEVLSKALRIFNDYCIRRHHGLCLLKLGYAYQAIGDAEQAAGYLRQSLSIFNELRLPAKADLATRELDRCRAGYDTGETRGVQGVQGASGAGMTGAA
jgi:DNA-binding SARP family transcriptional activator/tetratricopeptide (TPR) repeat protein